MVSVLMRFPLVRLGVFFVTAPALRYVSDPYTDAPSSGLFSKTYPFFVVLGFFGVFGLGAIIRHYRLGVRVDQERPA
jgi:hypothetical protein